MNSDRPKVPEQVRQRWEEEQLGPALDKTQRERIPSELPQKPMYTPQDTAGIDYAKDLGFPGEYPYTRGPYPAMYLGRLWTMRQYAGFGTPEETHQRFRYLLEQGRAQADIAEAAYAQQLQVETEARPVVGVNCFQEEESAPINLHRPRPELVEARIERLGALRRERDNRRVERTLKTLREEARGTGNLMYPIMEAVRQDIQAKEAKR
jgi:methylmalonyl-CoA mutase N-terminal domain/subunit